MNEAPFRVGSTLTLQNGDERVIIYDRTRDDGCRYSAIDPTNWQVACHWYASVEDLMDFYSEILKK